MLHHISYEVQPELVERMKELLETLGFAPVAAPEALGPGFTWFERRGTQVHLIATEEATAPAIGHAAYVVDSFPETMDALRERGFEVLEARQLWGERRGFVLGPEGHRLELMAAPPSRRSSP